MHHVVSRRQAVESADWLIAPSALFIPRTSWATRNHESPRTTNLYDRRQDEISLDEIERIAI